MTKEEAIKLLKVHRNGSIKPTDKVKEAIDTLIMVATKEDEKMSVSDRERYLMNRCYIFSGGTMCAFCGFNQDCKAEVFHRRHEE